jgi:hypothetical protein
MSTTTEGAIADAIIAAAEANKPAVLAAINAAEGGVEAFLTNVVNSVKPNGMILPTVWSIIKPSIVGELTSVEAQYPGTVIYALLDAEAHVFAKSIGG